MTSMTETKTPDVTPPDLIVIDGPEQATVADVPERADAGLPPVVGAQAWQVFRASRGVPEQADGLGFTYNHHVDMAVWCGRYYVAWNSCERDEDVWPSRELFSTSQDGATWDPPRELFPMGLSTCLRMYFYVSPNGRMLVIAGLRVSREEVSEETKGNLIVRQINADHAMGEVHALQLLDGTTSDLPTFDTSPDAPFVDACRYLLANTVFLEQQDLGTLLQDRRMKWHMAENWPGGVIPGGSAKWRSGKAFSFIRRPDGLRVGISKMGFTTCSADEGKTWSQPVVPPTLVTGKAKVWSQKTADGRYALAYNPTRRTRYPLVVVSGDGGFFSGMRVVQGELPRQRYPGLHRSVGPQYTRGISEWSSDGSIADDALWLVYSMSKEDIWVSRVPLPLTPDAATFMDDDFSSFPAGPRVAGWNTYAPKWAAVRVVGGTLRLTCRDPYDYAAATRMFPATRKVSIDLQLNAAPTAAGRIEIDVLAADGACAVRLALDSEGRIAAAVNGQTLEVGRFTAGQPIRLGLRLDGHRDRFDLLVNEVEAVRDAPFAEPAAAVQRITIRTGPHRNFGGRTPVDPDTDRPVEEATVAIERLTVIEPA